jgi:hypothetical protein
VKCDVLKIYDEIEDYDADNNGLPVRQDIVIQQAPALLSAQNRHSYRNHGEKTSNHDGI